MEIELFNEIESEINDLNIKTELKKELLYFNQKLNELRKKDNIYLFDILIDNMSKENINILLEHTTNIIEKYQISNEIIKYRNSTRDIEEIKNSILVIDDFNVFEDKILDRWQKETKINNFFTTLKLNQNIIILTCTNKIENHLKDVKSYLFEPNLCIHLKGKESPKELYESLISKYNQNNINNKLSYTTFKKIISSLEDNYYIKHFDTVEYIYNYSVKKIILGNNKIVNKKTFEELIDESQKEETKNKNNNNKLDELTGLESIKKELDTLYNYLEFINKNKIDKNFYLNMFFLGNPGTGKTTIARMYAEKLYELKYIDSNKLVEITPNDLMASYVGQTKETTRKILEKAKDGVLFIDEAYVIDDEIKRNNTFMKEALIELLKYLEEPKNVVIFAGYEDKMKLLYNSNPGLKSRIYKEIIFEDYKTNELYEILTKDLLSKGLTIEKESKDKIIKYIEKLKKDTNFGNARTIKQLSQKMIMNHADKKLEVETLTIDSTDLPKEEKNNKVRMGFSIYD